MSAECDITICNVDGLCFVKAVVYAFFMFSLLSCLVFVVMVSFGECSIIIFKGVFAVVAVVFMACDAERKMRVEKSWGGKKSHSVFNGFPVLPMCISNPNRAKCL